jgi:isopentenyl phosphate kinase
VTLTLIKLGGSLITDKRTEKSFRADQSRQIATEIAAALSADPTLPLIIGHGSGSFGHVTAQKYGTLNGVHTREQWRGFAEVATVAAELNYLMAETLQAAGIPILRVQPSASAQSYNGVIQRMELSPIHAALANGLVPLVYGDVSLDDVRGGTIISTEAVFTYLVHQLPVKRVLLLGEVAGVYDQQGQVIPEITLNNAEQYRASLGGSEGTDVTGGMLTKVTDMLALVERFPELQVYIIDGTRPEPLRALLQGGDSIGTLIQAGNQIINREDLT